MVDDEESSDEDEESLTAAAMTGPGVETPGEDSGTTACLALVLPVSFFSSICVQEPYHRGKCWRLSCCVESCWYCS